MTRKYYSQLWKELDALDEIGVDYLEEQTENLFRQYRDDIEKLTEWVMVINHKCWDYHEKHEPLASDIYSKLYYKYYEEAINYLDKENRKDDLSYFIRTLD